MTCLQPSRAALCIGLAIILSAGAGCNSECDVRPVDRLGWNPNYWPGCLAASHSLYPKVTRRAIWCLSWRAGFDDYWQLVEAVLRNAPAAENAVLVEKLPGQSEESYWYVLAIEADGKLLCYANSTDCFAFLWDEDANDPAPLGIDNPACGPARDAGGIATLRKLVEYGIHHAKGVNVHAPGGDNPAIDAGPFAVYVYRAADGASVHYVAEDLSLTPSVVRDTLPIMRLPQGRFAPSEDEMAEGMWDRLSRKEKDTWCEHYQATYAARLAVNGALRILYQHVVDSERRPPSGSGPSADRAQPAPRSCRLGWKGSTASD